MPIVWKQSMSTGVAELDNQHRGLISQLNALEEVVNSSNGSLDVERVLDLSEYFETFAREHFAAEERQMEVYKCGLLDRNRAEHEEFLGFMKEFLGIVQHESPDIEKVRQLGHQLMAWCERHWQEVDCHLKAAVAACPTCTIA